MHTGGISHMTFQRLRKTVHLFYACEFQELEVRALSCFAHASSNFLDSSSTVKSKNQQQGGILMLYVVKLPSAFQTFTESRIERIMRTMYK